MEAPQTAGFLLHLYYKNITSPSLGFHGSALETGGVDLNKIIWRYGMQERGKGTG